MDNAMISWFLETKDAKERIQGRDAARAWTEGAYDTLVHLICIERACSRHEADEWLAENVQERMANRD